MNPGYTRLDKDSEFSPTGLTIGGKITHTAIGAAWSVIPATALTDRNAIQIYNRSGVDTLYLEFDNAVAAGNGIPIAPGGYWATDIKDNILLYASTSGAAITVTIVELA